MKKIVLLALMAFTFAFTVKAGSADLFQLDEAKISTEMAQLNELENFVATNDGVSLTNLLESNDPSVANMDFAAPTGPMGAMVGDPPLGIPSFVWGLCLGIPGIAIVYFVAEDKEQTMKAVWGCVTQTGVVLVIYILMIVVFVSSAATVV